MLIDKDKTVAVAIDYQERILPAMDGREELLSCSCRFLEGLKILGVPVFLTQQYTRGLGMTVNEITKAAGTAEYTDKLEFSAAGALEGLLPAAEVTPFVLVCGIEAHVCVLQTCIALKEKGYTPLLVTDCIASRRKSDMEVALRRAQQEGVLLSTSEAVLFELLGAAGTPVFKQISRLVK